MPPAVIWGVGVGLVIAAVDTLSLVLMRSPATGEWPIADADFLVNVILYSLIGFRVGKATGVIREAAEAGVIAGVLVGLIAIGASLILRPGSGGLDSVGELVAIMAQNIAIGGVLAIMAGWLGTRARQDQPASRR